MVERVKAHPRARRRFYPGGRGREDYSIMRRPMGRGGGMISFEIEATKEDAQRFLNSVSFIHIAVSLGDAETLIEHPAIMTHAVVPEEDRLKMGITDGMIRLSVGLEAWEDIWEDLECALDTV